MGTELQRQAQQRQRDLLAYNQQKANLTQGGIENLSNAVDTGAAYAAYGANKAADTALAATAPATALAEPAITAPGIRGLNTPGYLPSLNGGRYRTSSVRYGVRY